MTFPESTSSHLRPLKCAYDPLYTPTPGSEAPLTKKVASILHRHHPNSIPITPSASQIGVPWPSSLPHCRQNIYWREAESAVRALLPQIHALSHTSGAKIPKELQQNNGGKSEGDLEKMKAIAEKETEFVDTVVGCAIYMHPNASKERTVLIAQALLVLWTHDDTVEHSPDDLGHTATDHIMHGFDPTSASLAALETSAPLFASLFSGLFAESPSLGLQLAHAMLAFIRNTSTQRASSGAAPFASLRAYLDFRSVDFGRAFNFAAVRFALDLDLGGDELASLKALEDLADDHHMLVNDLYSFDKELREHERGGGDGKAGRPLVNAVAVVRELLGLESWHEAKREVGNLILSWEEKTRVKVLVLDVLRAGGALDERQWSYVEGVLQSMTGNQFFSATAPRYCRAVKGKEEGPSTKTKRNRDMSHDGREFPTAKQLVMVSDEEEDGRI